MVISPHYRVKNPRPGTIWRRTYYDYHKARLIEFLGWKCAECGTTEDLTFDHIDGDRDWEPKKVHSTKRIRLYTEDALNDKIQLLCRKHNSSKSDTSDD